MDIIAIIEQAAATLKKYGARFENVRFEERSGGVSVHVCESALPYSIVLPDEVLLDFSCLDFSGDDLVFDDAALPDDIRDLWRGIFRVTLSDARVAQLRSTLDTFAALPDSIRSKLGGIGLGFLCDQSRLSDVQLKKLLICSRYIGKNGKLLLMPVLDFVNHGPSAPDFQIEGGCIQISGMTPDEVLVNYNYGDVFHYLSSYFFPAESKHAYSYALNLSFNDRPLRIERSYLVGETLTPKARSPKILVREDGGIVLSALRLGQREHPNAVIPAFKLAWEKAGLPHAEELFKAIYRTNVSLFVDLLRDLEGVEGMAADWLRQATYQQLKLMAEH